MARTDDGSLRSGLGMQISQLMRHDDDWVAFFIDGEYEVIRVWAVMITDIFSRRHRARRRHSRQRLCERVRKV